MSLESEKLAADVEQYERDMPNCTIEEIEAAFDEAIRGHDFAKPFLPQEVRQVASRLAAERVRRVMDVSACPYCVYGFQQVWQYRGTWTSTARGCCCVQVGANLRHEFPITTESGEWLKHTTLNEFIRAEDVKRHGYPRQYNRPEDWQGQLAFVEYAAAA